MIFFVKIRYFKPKPTWFLKNKNTITGIFEFDDKIVKGIDEHESVLALLVVLLCDCVDLKLLLHKLEPLGIRGIVLHLNASYLKDRKQTVGLKTEQ